MLPLKTSVRDKGKSKVVLFGKKEPLRPEDSKSDMVVGLEQIGGVVTAGKAPTNDVKIVGSLFLQGVERELKPKSDLIKVSAKCAKEYEGQGEIVVGTMVCPITMKVAARQVKFGNAKEDKFVSAGVQEDGDMAGLGALQKEQIK